jgi:predicted Holliday junction resolvase-like endonuclease
MDIIILSLLFVLVAGGTYFLSVHVKETREKMFKEMEELESQFEKDENLQRFEKRFEPVAKAEPQAEPKPAEEETPAESKPKKKKSSGRRGRPAKPKGEA